MRDGSELVGWGMATGVWEALQMPAAARIVLTANGHAEVSCAASDIGTGTYTILAQVAADTLGLPIENISVKLGDSTPAASAGGRWVLDGGLRLARGRGDGRRGPQGATHLGEHDQGIAAGRDKPRRHHAGGRQDCQQA